MQMDSSPPLPGVPVNDWPIWSWSIPAALLLVDAAWLLLTPLSLHVESYARIGVIGSIAGALLFLRRLARSDQLHTLLTGACFGLLAWPALRLFNHLTMTTAFPLADAQLAAWDAALGFDWLAYVKWIDRYPAILHIMDISYSGLTLYSCGTFLALLLWCGPARAREFVLLFLLAAVAISTAGLFFPAVAAMAHYAPDPALFQNVKPDAGTYHMRHLVELRTNPNHIFSLSDLPGLVTFPSFHTAMGVIAIYCARNNASILLPIAAVNLLMIASTPIFGSHYVVDIVAGAAIVGLLASALRWVEARSGGVALKGAAAPCGRVGEAPGHPMPTG